MIRAFTFLLIGLSFPALGVFESQSAGGGGPVRNEEQLRQVKKCNDRSCFYSTMGIQENRWTDKAGRKVMRLDGPNLETMIFYNYLGGMDEVLFIRKNGTRHSKIEYLSDEKKSTFFRLDGRVEKEILDQSKIRKTTTFKYGKKVEKIEVIEKISYSRGRIHQCVEQEFGAVINDGDTLNRVASDIGNALRRGVSDSEWNIQFNNCPEDRQTQIGQIYREAMSEGIQCLLDPDRGGSARGTRDAVLLTLMTMNPNKPFHFSCPERIEVDGNRFMGMAEPVIGPNSPGLMIDRSILQPPGRRGRVRDMSDSEIEEAKVLMFHETLHNIGHEHDHGQLPDITRACEACCFSAVSGRGADDTDGGVTGVCEMCRMGDNSVQTPSQRVDYAVQFMRNESSFMFNEQFPDRNWSEAMGLSIGSILSVYDSSAYPNPFTDFASQVLSDYGNGDLNERAAEAASIGVELPEHRTALMGLYIQKELNGGDDEDFQAAMSSLESVIPSGRRKVLKIMGMVIAKKKQGVAHDDIVDATNAMIRSSASSGPAQRRLMNQLLNGQFSPMFSPLGISF